MSLLEVDVRKEQQPLQRQTYGVGQFAHIRSEGPATMHDPAEDVAGHALFVDDHEIPGEGPLTIA